MTASVRISALAFLALALLSPCAAQRPELVVQAGHTASIRSVAFSPNGQTLASAASDNTIKLWDVATGTELRTLVGHTLGLRSVSFSPDKKFLASLALDGVILWDVVTGEKMRSLADSKDVQLFVISPDAKVIAGVRTWNCDIFLWDVTSGQRVRQLAGHSDWVTSVAFSPDGRTLASSSRDKTVKLWDWTSGRQLRTLVEAGDALLSVAFKTGGQILAAGAEGGSITFWDLRTQARVGTIVVKDSKVDALFFSPDGATLMVTTGLTSTFYDLQTGQAYNLEAGGLKRGKKDESFAYLGAAGGYSARLSPDWKRLATPSSSVVMIFDDLTKTEPRFLGQSLAGPDIPVFSPDKKTLAVATMHGLKLWPLTNGHEPQLLDSGEANSPSPNATGRPHTVVFSPDGKTVFDGGRLWSVVSGQQLLNVREWFGDAYDGVFSSDGRKLALWSGGSGGVKILDVTTGATLLQIQADWIACLAFSPDGQTLAGSAPGRVTIWDVTTGRALRQYEVVIHKFIRAEGIIDGRTWREYGQVRDDVRTLAFSADGQRLAGAGRLSTRIWEVASGRILQTLIDGREYGFASVALSPDGQMLASLDQAPDLRLWDVARGQQIKVPDPLPAWVWFDGAGLLTINDRSFLVAATALGLNIRVAQTNEELAQLFVFPSYFTTDHEQLWLVTTPDGLFDGHPDAWSKAVWRFDNNTFNFAPVEAFFKEFFYPGLLQEIFGGRRPKAPAKDFAAIDTRQPTVKLTQLHGQPILDNDGNRLVELRLKEPPRTSEVVLEVTDNDGAETRPGFPPTSGARDLRLFRNGTLVRVWRGDLFAGQSGCVPAPRAPRTPRRAICKATVQVGWDNQFTAYAFNHENVKSLNATAILRGGLAQSGDFYVLAIGINHYENADYNLNFAVADALEFGAELARSQQPIYNYSQKKVVSLTDAEATKQNILYALACLSGDASSQPPATLTPQLKQKLSNLTQLQPNDALVVYFAGHGTAQADRFYLLPHDLGYMGSRTAITDAALHTILAHSISDRELEQAFEKIDAGQILMVIDACNSGQALEAEEKRRGPMNSQGLAQLAYEKGMYILTAAQSFQAAQEATRLGHGFLTYALIEEGLRQGKADTAPADGTLFAHEWLDFATETVPRLQAEEMVEALRARGLHLAFVAGDEQLIDPRERAVQRPRVFYRRELGTQPLVVARTATPANGRQ